MLGELRLGPLYAAGMLRVAEARVNTNQARLSYHIRNVPAFSTIEVSPGCGFTMPRKRLVFSSPASLVSKDDGQQAVVDEIAEGSGMGVRGNPSQDDEAWHWVVDLDRSPPVGLDQTIVRERRW